MSITLMPLSPTLHVGALQHLYRATPAYWQQYQYMNVPAGQAASDMRSAADTPGRYLMGVVQPIQPDHQSHHHNGATSNVPDTPDKNQSGELIGLVDFRLDWPDPSVAYLGMIMIAERCQRQGVGTAAWQLLRPWLAASAQINNVQLRVEQFSPTALQFFKSLGFQLTGEFDRMKVGEQLVRFLVMELNV